MSRGEYSNSRFSDASFEDIYNAYPSDSEKEDASVGSADWSSEGNSNDDEGGSVSDSLSVSTRSFTDYDEDDALDDVERRVVTPPSKEGRELEDLAEVFKQLRDEPFDVLDFCNTWIDDGMREVFAAGAILGAINYAKKALVISRVAGIYGFFWNYFDALGGILAAIDGFRSANEAARNRKTKRTFATVDGLGAAQLTVGTTLTIVAVSGGLSGAAAAASLPLAAITFAVCMTISAIKEAYFLQKAIKKTDPMYLLKDRLIKCLNLEKEIAVLEGKNLLDPAVNANIARLQKKRDRLYGQALSIARVEFHTDDGSFKEGEVEAFFDDNEELKKLKNYEEFGIGQLSEICKRPTDDDVAFVKFIQAKQNAKVRHHAFGVVTWSLAAVGMSLIAAGIFFPPLLIAGVVIALASAGCKTAEVAKLDKRAYNLFSSEKHDLSMNNFVVDALARRQKRNKIYDEFIKGERKSELKNVIDEYKGKKLNSKTRVKLHLAYKLTMEAKEKEGKDKGKVFDKTQYNEKAITRQFMGLSWFKRKVLLNGAMSKYIANQALENHTFKEKLSDKDQKRVVAEKLRGERRDSKRATRVFSIFRHRHPRSKNLLEGNGRVGSETKESTNLERDPVNSACDVRQRVGHTYRDDTVVDGPFGDDPFGFVSP